MTVSKTMRELVHWTEDEIWKLDELDVMEVIFDDGVEQVTPQSTIISWYLWEFHRTYPELSCLRRHHIRHDRVTKTIHVRYMSRITRDLFNLIGPDHYSQEKVEDIVSWVNQNLQNAMAVRIEQWVTSIDILDFLAVWQDPDFVKVHRETKITPHGIRQGYEKAITLLKNPNKFIGNPIAEGIRSELIPANQIMQCLFMRGYCSELDQSLYDPPVLSSYFTGLSTLYESMVESRSASRSQYNTSEPVKDAEYFNRLMQLIASYVALVEAGDCGSIRYVQHTLTQSDLTTFAGKYYLDEETSTLKVITPEDHHLRGKPLKIRSLFYCNHPNRQTVCEKCYGQLFYSIPSGANIGHLGSTTAIKDISQVIISTKHYDATAIAAIIYFADEQKRYIHASETDPHMIYLSQNLSDYEDVFLVIDKDDAKELLAVVNADVDMLRISNISSIRDIALRTYHYETLTEIPIPMSIGSCRSHMSRSLLQHCKTHKWSTDDRGNIVINMKSWDYSEPAFIVAKRQLSMMDFFLTIQYILKSSKDDKPSTRRTHTSLQKTMHLQAIGHEWKGLMYLYNIVSEKFKINIVHLETMVQALRVVDRKAGDYRLPRGHERVLYDDKGNMEYAPSLCNYTEIMSNRSAGVMMAYQEHVRYLEALESTLDRPTHPSPMDYALMGDRME